MACFMYQTQIKTEQKTFMRVTFFPEHCCCPEQANVNEEGVDGERLEQSLM